MDDMECSDFVEEELETTIKLLLLGTSCTGKTSLLTHYLKPTTTFTRCHSPTTTTEYYEHKTTTGPEDVTVMLWDTPPFEVMYPVVKGYRGGGGGGKDPSLKYSSLYKGLGGVILTLDIFNEDFDLHGISLVLSRIKKECGSVKTPPVTVVFGKWDLVDRTDDYGFDVKAMYDAVLNVLDDKLTPSGYASLRTSVSQDRNVAQVFEMAVENYFRWGKGRSDDVLQDASTLSAKKPKSKKKKSKPAVAEKEKLYKDDEEDKFQSSLKPKPKNLFGDPADTQTAHSSEHGSPPIPSDALAPQSGGSGAPTTPRRRRTGGKKNAVDLIQSAAKSAVPQENCVIS